MQDPGSSGWAVETLVWLLVVVGLVWVIFVTVLSLRAFQSARRIERRLEAGSDHEGADSGGETAVM